MTRDFSLLSVAVKNLKRKPLRTVMLAASIMLLATVLVFALSFIYRVHSGVRIMTERLGADVIVVPAGSRGPAEEVLLENQAKSFYMDRDILGRVAKIPGVDKTTTQTYLVTLAGLCCSVPQSMVVAFDQDTDFILKPWLKKAVPGKLKKGEAIVGAESAFNINIGLVDVDSMLFGNLFRMVGVLDKTDTGLDTAVFIGSENMGDILKSGTAKVKPGQISIIFVKVKQGVDPKTVADAVENTIIEADAVTRKDIGKSVISTLRDLSGIFSMTIVVVSLLSAFLAWAVFSAVANERSKEVGIMRALGAREDHVMKLFLAEVVLIGAAGSIAGIVAGTLLSLSLSNAFTILKNIATDLHAADRAAIAVIGFIVGTGVCSIGALAPIRRMKRLEPLVVIKEG